MKEYPKAVLTRYQVTLLAAMFWPYEEVDNAVDICFLESCFNPNAHNQKGEDSRGLWQINVEAHPEYKDYNLFDPVTNAYCAYEIWKRAKSWRPWFNAANRLGLL